jgi:SAM domain (Sterile alpha motif)
MDLGGWLRSLGLEQYEAAFSETAIDDTVLSGLTDDHLREIGIPLGARIKLLRAIAALPERTETIPTTNAERARPPVEGAERRQLTVMFCDLVGSTALSTSMDPEDLREIISAYQKCVAETVRRFAGFVAKYMGDGSRNERAPFHVGPPSLQAHAMLLKNIAYRRMAVWGGTGSGNCKPLFIAAHVRFGSKAEILAASTLRPLCARKRTSKRTYFEVCFVPILPVRRMVSPPLAQKWRRSFRRPVGCHVIRMS